MPPPQAAVHSLKAPQRPAHGTGAATASVVTKFAAVAASAVVVVATTTGVSVVAVIPEVRSSDETVEPPASVTVSPSAVTRPDVSAIVVARAAASSALVPALCATVTVYSTEVATVASAGSATTRVLASISVAVAMAEVNAAVSGDASGSVVVNV